MITLNKCSILVTIYIILNTFEYMIKIKDIFKIKSEDEFELMANKIFEFQFNNNNIYRSFCDLINKSPSDVTNSKQIPNPNFQHSKHVYFWNLLFELCDLLDIWCLSFGFLY